MKIWRRRYDGSLEPISATDVPMTGPLPYTVLVDEHGHEVSDRVAIVGPSSLVANARAPRDPQADDDALFDAVACVAWPEQWASLDGYADPLAAAHMRAFLRARASAVVKVARQ